jgi:protoporphyrinogen oxidase
MVSFRRLSALALLALALFVPAARAQEEKELPAARPPVIVVGGGFCGLVAAHRIAERKEPVIVLEKEASVGGRTIAGQRRGICYPRGTSYVSRPEDRFRTLFDDLGIDPIEVPGPADATYMEGKIHVAATVFDGWDGLPLAAGEKAQLVRIRKRVRDDHAAYVWPIDSVPPSLRRLDRLSVRQYLDECAGGKVAPRVAALIDVFCRAVRGGGIDEISALCALDEFAYEFGGVEDESEDDRESAPEKGARSEMYTAERTLHQLCERLAERLGPDRVFTECEVTSVADLGPTVEVTYRPPTGAPRTVTGVAAILTVPAPVALAIAKGLPEAKRAALAKVRYAPYAVVNLFSDRPLWEGSFDIDCLGLFFTTLYDFGRVPRAREKGIAAAEQGILGVYVPPRSRGDDAPVKLSDKELLAKVLADLERVIPGARAKVKGHDIARFALGLPVTEPGYADLLRPLRERAGRIFFAGDYTEDPTLEGSFDSAERAADEVIELLNRSGS